MKLILYSLGILLLLVTITLTINLTGIMPTHEYLENRCTRYCHNSHCPHFEVKVATKNSLALKIQPAYQTAIRMLQHNSLGLSYTTINLLVFVISFPVLILLLFFNLWKK